MIGRDLRKELTTRQRVAIVAIPLLLIVALPLVFAWKVHSRQQGLRQRGVITSAEVLGTSHSGDTDYLRVHLLDCGCVVLVATSNLAAHPVGSTLPVRYDPLHPGHAQALVDAPNPYEPVLLIVGGVVVALGILIPLLLVARRRRRASLALVHTTAPTRRVRVEAWERVMRNTTIPYLSVYSTDIEPGEPPLFCLAVTDQVLARARDEVLDLYGSAKPGEPIALRAGDLTIVPSGKSHSAEWEAKHRADASGLMLAPPDSMLGGMAWSGPAEPPIGPLFADAAEAGAYRRNVNVLRGVFPFVVVAPMIRLLPDRLVWFGMVPLAVVIVVLYGSLWSQRRLVDRMAARIVSPTPTGRNGRRAARAAVTRRISSDAGTAELARLLSTTPEALAAAARRSVRVMYGSFGLLAIVLAGVIVRVATV